MTQREQILAHLRQHGEITPLDAFKRYGCFRLAARIGELRQDGYRIETVYEGDLDKKWARYVLVKQTEAA